MSELSLWARTVPSLFTKNDWFTLPDEKLSERSSAANKKAITEFLEAPGLSEPPL